jgi:hypothetical protein
MKEAEIWKITGPGQFRQKSLLDPISVEKNLAWLFMPVIPIK